MGEIAEEGPAASEQNFENLFILVKAAANQFDKAETEASELSDGLDCSIRATTQEIAETLEEIRGVRLVLKTTEKRLSLLEERADADKAKSTIFDIFIQFFLFRTVVVFFGRV